MLYSGLILKTFTHAVSMSATKVQISLRILAVWSAGLCYSLSREYSSHTFSMQNLNSIACLCRYACWFEPYVVANPKERLSTRRGLNVKWLSIPCYNKSGWRISWSVLHNGHSGSVWGNKPDSQVYCHIWMHLQWMVYLKKKQLNLFEYC